MSQENVEVVRRIFEAAARRDSGAVLALYDPEVEWDASRTLGVVSDQVFHGHDGLRRFWREWRDARQAEENQYDELMEVGDAVVSIAIQLGEGRASGLAITRTLAGVWSLREGKVARVVWFPTREEALEAAGPSE